MDWADQKADEIYTGVVLGKLDRKALAVILRVMQTKAVSAAFEVTQGVIKETFEQHGIGGGDK